MLFESLPFEKRHRNERLAIDVRDLVDGTDIGMVECGGGLGLAQEAFFGYLVIEQAATLRL